MRKYIFCFVMSLAVFQFNITSAQVIDIEWNVHFKKEVQFSCSLSSVLCEKICDHADFCIFEEKTCKSCIGTGPKMHMILSELGLSIKGGEVRGEDSFLFKFFEDKNFVTLGRNDAYNILDSFGSLNLFKKFENLCPSESLNQILFLEIHPFTNEILRPKLVYCEFEDHQQFFDIKINSTVVFDKLFSALSEKGFP